MSAKKRALGRGLDSLIAASQPRKTDEGELGLLEIPLKEIRPNINQPRKEFAEENITELANSIRSVGILQPILVRKQDGYYELIAGERRFRAAETIPLETISCRLTTASDERSFEMALVENLQREDLNPMEESRAFKSLIAQFGMTQEQVAERVGKSRSAVANSLRLLHLPLDIQDDILENRITPGHARAILAIADKAKQRSLRNLIMAKNLSVRQAEAQSRKINKPRQEKPPQPTDILVQMRSLQETFSLKIGVPVHIKPVSAEAGKLEIEYRSLDDFDLISDFFGVENT